MRRAAWAVVLAACGPADTGPGGVSVVPGLDPAPEVVSHPWDYVLFAPFSSTTTWLVDETGEAVHAWESDRTPGESVYLLDDGSLLRTETVPSGTFAVGGVGGAVRRLSWEGEVLWEATLADERVHQHHDIAPMPNGNLLAIAWEAFTADALLAAGRDPALVDEDGAWMEQIVELDGETGEVVWTWRVMDHVAQDRDPSAPNHVASLADHPDRVDIDYRVDRRDPDWLHANSVDYHPELDRVALSVHDHSEVWIIDRATGTIAYRWGNPAAWSGGDADDQQLFLQHDARWIPEDRPGAGELLVFDNGHPVWRRWSRVLQVALPLEPDGSYRREEPAITWVYEADPPTDLFATHLSGAQRQPEGTTLICDGPGGRFLGVDEDGVTLWSWSYGGEVFRAERYPADHPALAGRVLTGLGVYPVFDPGDRPELPGG